MDFGLKMRTMRTLRKLSQEDLGMIVGVSDGYISWIEIGRLNPTPTQEHDIRVALGWPEVVDGMLEMVAKATVQMRRKSDR